MGRGFIIITLLYLCTLPFVTAYPPGWSSDIPITPADNWAIDQKITVDSSNNVHISWRDLRDGNWEIYYAKLDERGNTLIDDKRLTYDPSWKEWPSIVTDSDNRVHIAWHDNRTGWGSQYATDIFYTKLDDNGNTIVEDQRISFDPSISNWPDVAIDSDNNIHIVWADWRNVKGELYYSKLDSAGNILVSEKRITFTANDSGWPSIAADSNDNIHVAWVEVDGSIQFQGGNITVQGNEDIYYKKLDNNGNTLIDDVRVTDDPERSTAPSIGIDTLNNIFIAWADYTNWKLYFKKLDYDGNTLISKRELTHNPTYARDPSLAVDQDDNVHTAWFDDLDIYYKKLDENGNILTDIIQLTTGRLSWFVSLAVDQEDSPHLAWYKMSINKEKDETEKKYEKDAAVTKSQEPPLEEDTDDGRQVFYKRGIPTNMADLVIDSGSITYTPQNPLEESPISITLNARNDGYVNAQNVRVDFLVNNIPYATRQVSIPALSSVNLDFNWAALREGTYTISFVLDRYNQVPEFSETNNQASKSISVRGFKLEILAIPINWEGTQDQFNTMVNTQVNNFIMNTNLVACQNRVKVKKLNVTTQNMRNFTCSERQTNVLQVWQFALSQESIFEIGEYDAIMGLANRSPCWIGGSSLSNLKTFWIADLGDWYHISAAHEIGHLFNLRDEYCSKPGGSRDNRCNDGGSTYGGNDINFLDSNEGCDPRAGLGCCGPSLGFTNCSQVNYGICCAGNVNLANGRSIMSYVEANPPRMFDQHARMYFGTQAKLNCGGKTEETTTLPPVLSIDLTVSQDGIVNDNSILLLEGEPYETSTEPGAYNLSIQDSAGNILTSQSFDLYFDYSGPVSLYINNYSTINYTTIPLHMDIPYTTPMHELRLYKDQELIFTKILDFCNNNQICESSETYLTCPTDCPLDQQDGICINEEDDICDPDCAEGADPDCLSWTDLEVMNFTKLYPAAPTTSDEIMFYYKIFNYGNRNISNLFFRIDTDSSVPDIQNLLPLSIQMNSSYIGFAHWRYLQPGTYQPTFTIDSQNNHSETNETNNQMGTTIQVTGGQGGMPPSGSPLFIKAIAPTGVE